MKAKYLIVGIIFLLFFWTLPYLLEGKSLNSVFNELFYSIGLIVVLGILVFLFIIAVNQRNK